MIFLNKKERLLFSIVGNPLKATIVVGTSIIILLQLIGLLQHTASWFSYLKWIVPFVPPFVITRTARKINQMQAEYRFIQDAVPFIFVSYPSDLSVHGLLNNPARMLSDSFERFLADCHHNPRENGPIPNNLLQSQDYFLSVLEDLIKKYKTNDQTASVDGTVITFELPDKRKMRFLFYSTLVNSEDGIKWQGILAKVPDTD